MKLLSSLKQKKRYIAFEILSQAEKFSSNEVAKEVSQALTDFLGQLGLSKAAPLFLKERFNYPKQIFVIKVNNKYVDKVKSALILLKKIKNKQVIIKSLKVSGTIKGVGGKSK